MNEQELWEWLAAKLRRQGVPEHVRGWAEEEGYVRDALMSSAGRDDLLRGVRRFLKYAGNDGDARGTVDTRREDPAPALTDERERARSAATAIAVAEMAAEAPKVQRYRQEILGGAVLTSDGADAFLDSPALAVFDARWLVAQKIPIVGHEARLVTSDAVRFDNGCYGERVVVHVDPPNDSIEMHFRWTGKTTSRREFQREVQFPGPRGVPTKRRVWERSVLFDLAELAAWLAKRYMWREADAAWFVLTGVEPPIPPVRSSARWQGWGGCDRALVTLDVDPCTSSRTVERVYREWQRRLRPAKARSMDHGVEVFRFVVAHKRTNGRRPIWKALAGEWDRTHPDRSYGTAWRNLSRDYHRAKKALLFPYGRSEEPIKE